MKKTLVFILISALALSVGCGQAGSNQDTASTAIETVAQTSDTAVADSGTDGSNVNDTRVFDAETLAQYNGKNGNPAYVAYEGKVYDVSTINAWKNGMHQGRFEAGKDYTDVLNNQAPHSATNLTDNAPVVGEYKE